jgi:hypothetical protein
VVLPPIFIIHLHSRDISLLLKGRTRTATFTDDMIGICFPKTYCLYL